MRNGRWWAIGLLGFALAGTVAVVSPSQAQTTTFASNVVSADAELPTDRKVQQEASALASRADVAIHRTQSLLEGVAAGDLSGFKSQRISLAGSAAQWPVSLFQVPATKNGAVTVDPSGEAYLDGEDLATIQRSGSWVCSRDTDHSVVIAAANHDRAVIASRLPIRYFTDAIARLPQGDGVARYVLDPQGVSLDPKHVPNATERDLIAQLMLDPSGFVATADSYYALARVPSTGWLVVVRYPIGGPANPLMAFDPGFLSGPSFVSSVPASEPGLPKGLWLLPLAGLALLFGVGVARRNGAYSLEGGPRSFGEHALRIVTSPMRDRRGERDPKGAQSREVASFQADIPVSMPNALGGDDVEFLRSEQVRNLREVWNHTEERLSGQRTWVRDEIRRIQESTNASLSELGAIVNLAEQRLEDARTAWGEVQSSLLGRIEEARLEVAEERVGRASLFDRVQAVDEQLDAIQTSLAGIQVDQGIRSDRIDGELQRLSKAIVRLDQVEDLLGDIVLLSARLDEHGARLEVQERWTRDRDDMLAHVANQSAAMDDQLAEIQAHAKGIAQQRNAIDASIADFHAHVGSMDQQVAKLDGRVSDFEGRVRDLLQLGQEVAGLQEGMVSVEVMRTFMERAAERIAELEAAQQTLGHETEAQIEAHKNELDMRLLSLIADWRAIGHKMAETQNGMEKLEKAHTTLERNVDKRFEEVEGHAHMFEVAALQRFSQQDARVQQAVDLSDRVSQLGEQVTRHQTFEATAQQRLAQGEAKISQLEEFAAKGQASLDSASQRLSQADARLQQLDEVQARTLALETTTHQRLAQVDSRLSQLQDWVGRTRHLESGMSKRFEEAHAKLQALSDTVNQLHAQGDGLSQRLATSDTKVSQLAKQVQAVPKLMSAEVNGLKSRLDGLALANARQQEAINSVIESGELSKTVRQLAEQGKLMGEALEAQSAAAARSESWVTEQVSALTRQTAQLTEVSEGLENRVHMVVQVLSKLSR